MQSSTASSSRQISRGQLVRHGQDVQTKGRPTGRPFTCTNRLGLCAWSRSSALSHALGHDSDLLDARALGRIDDVDDVAVAQRAIAADEHRLVLAVLEDGAKPLFELGDLDVLVVDRDL